MNRLIRCASGALVLGLAAGCATTTRTADDSDEYVYITEVGTNIPRKVKKGTTSSGTLATEPGDSRTLDTLQRDQTIRNMKRDGT